ncbi:GA-like domain-containing protein, partial [Streptococcus thoraltensis]|uniref:GA-like domain-containing protein n=1 Tax=Streptococcus thoraltensis TaxID=55085 RepID=UPI001F594864
MFFKQKQRFSIRKYSFGAASVLLGTVILGMAAPEASADTVQPETQQVLKEENTSVQTSDLSSPEMEAVSETPEIKSQEKLVQSTDTPIAEPVVASENPEGVATSVHATRVPSTDIPVTELADPSESAEVPATQVQETPAPSADTPVAEPVAASESPEGDETSAQEENHPAPSALISDTADKPHVRSARSLADSPADQQNLLEDSKEPMVDKNLLKDHVSESDLFKPTPGYTKGGKEEQDAYDKAIAEGEKLIEDVSATQEAVDMAIEAINDAAQKVQLSATDALVKAAEEAAKAAQAKKIEVEQDGAVSPDEKKAVDDLNKITEQKREDAIVQVISLPDDTEQEPFKKRLDKVTLSEVTVGNVESKGKVDNKAEQSDAPVAPETTVKSTDDAADSNSKEAADDAVKADNQAEQDLALTVAEAAVKAAEEAAKAGQAKKKEVEQDATVDTDEAKAVDDLNKKTLDKITSARNVVDRLPEVAEKATLKDRLDKIKTSGVVVGIVGTAIARAELHTRLTEKAARAAAAKKREVEADGAVNPAEKVEVDALNVEVTKSKKLAEEFVGNLPESREKTEFKDRLSKATTSEVVINDFDKDGKADKQDILKAAEAAVQAADDVAQIAKSQKVEAESDGRVTQEEKTTIDGLNERVTANKESATSKVNNLPDSPDKVALKKWLDKITTSEVTVGTADNKVKSDKSDTAIARADFFTTSTESKAKAAAAKKKEVEADGAVNPAEKAEVDALNGQVANSKKLAEQFVDTLPEGEEKKEFKDRLSKVTTSGVKINDADSNGKSDELENKLSGFENIISTAEASVQEAKDKKAEVEKDGFVTPAEKQAVDSLNAGITNVKEVLKKFIDTLPEIPVKKDLSDRVAKLTTSEVTVGDVDSKGKATPNEAAALGLVKTLLTSAEQAAQKAQAKKTEVESDGVVTEAEKAEVDKLNTQITDSKKQLSTVLENLAAGTEKDGFKERFDKLTTSEVTVGAVDNSKDKADSQEEQGIVPIVSGDVAQRILKDTEAVVESIEKMAQIIKAAAKEAESDGLVTPEEKASIDNLNKDLKTQKEHVASKVDNLPDSPDKAALKERLDKVTTVEVTVNDADSNGKVDAEEVAALRTAKNLATDAEQLVQSAKTKKAEAESDGVVTSEEKAEIDSLNTRITNSQKDLSTLLDNLADSTEKTALKERLAKLTTSEVTVGDVDSKIKSDKLKNAIARADFFTTSTEKAAQTAAAKKQEVEADGVVNPAEKQEVDALNAEVTKSKKLAEQLIDTLPENSETKELKDRLAKVTTADVTVNDADSDGKVDNKEQQDIVPVVADDTTDSKDKADNKDEQTADNTGKVDSKDEQSTDNTGKADSQDERDVALIDAQEAVKDAEDTAQFGKDNKAEAEKDGVISPSEKEHLDQIDISITAAKEYAQGLVDKLPDSDAKKALQERLAKVTTVEVTVSDVNNDSKADNKEQQDIVPVVADDSKGKSDNPGQSDANLSPVEHAIKAAEDAAQVAQKVKAEVEADGAVTPEEKAEVDQFNTIATDSKKHAQSLVNELPDSDAKKALQERLDKVTTADVVVNDYDSNGKADDAERLEKAEALVKAAEDAAKLAQGKKIVVEQDRLVTPAEKQEVDVLNDQVTNSKKLAENFVDNVPEGKEKEGFKERLAKVMTAEVTVNDADNDGKVDNQDEQVADNTGKVDNQDEQADAPVAADDSDGKVDSKVEQSADNDGKVDNKDEQAVDNTGKADSQAERDVALSHAQQAVEDAEEAAQFGKENKTEAEKDGVITPSEKEHLDQIDTIITAAKQHAQSLVDELPDSDAKKALQERLAKITTSQVTVNDADSNGKADDKERLEKAEAAVKSVEALAQSAKDKKKEVESDGVVNPAEKEEVDRLNEKVTVNKDFVTSLINDNLPDSPEKAAFMDRLAKITTSEVTVNDADSNGKADSQDKQEAALAAAEAAVKAAEDAAKAGQDKKAEVEQDRLVTPAEKTAVDNLNKATADKKTAATALVDKLPDGDSKTALKDRLGKVTPSEVTVNDADSNGKADSQDKQEAALAAAEAAVKAAEAAAKAGQDKKAEVEKDGLVTPAEKTAVDNLNKATADKKTAATALVDKLPDGDSKTALKDRLGKVTPSQVTVNDANSNGKADNLDSVIARADFFTTSTERAAQATKTKKAEVEKDGLVTPAEKQAVDSLNAEVTKSKQAAEKFVDTLPEGKEKNEFKARLAKVTTSEVTVNDADSNGKADSQDRLEVAEAAVKAAEAAAKAGQDKKAEVEKDGLVNPLEKTVVDGLNKTTVDKKNVASALVDTLPDSADKDALQARLAKVTTSEVTVNDANSNGKADTQDADLATAETAVKAAEAAAKAGQDKKAEVEKDGLVTPAEKTAVDDLNKTTVDKKDVASDLVDGLSDNAAKTALKERLSKVTTSQVTVNDADSNGKADSQDRLEVTEAAVKAAEAAAKADQDKKAEVEKDGLVNPLEKTVVDGLNKTTIDKKNVADALVDTLADSAEKDALQARLAKVTTSEVTVNDADSNGKVDSQDAQEVDTATVEPAVKAAEDAAQVAKDKKAEVEADGLVNPSEKEALDELNAIVTDSKKHATALVDNLPDSAAKTALQARLAKVTTSEVTVNDTDSNGKADDQDRLEVTEAAVKAGQDKKAEVESDGLVNPLEKTVVDGLNKTTVDKKNVANALVDTLADSADKDALQARLSKVTTSEVTVNDANSNGKADTQDTQEAALASAEAAVKSAEAAAKAGQEKKAEIESDGLVTPAEKTAITDLNKTTVDEKDVASALVDTLADSAAKTALQARLAKVMISEVTVNDADSNGKVDSQDTQEAALASAEAAVKAAEAAAKAGQDKKAEVESDGL